MKRAALILALGLAAGCSKVPLESDAGSISFGSLDWFANEKVAYVFFSLSERTTRLINPQWQLTWTETTPGGGTQTHPYAPIDFDQGVHLHSPQNCGDNQICASYSFRSDNPVADAAVKFLYDTSSAEALELGISTQNHPAGTTGNSYSALPYGVFDQGNTHLQVRIQNNFATLPDALVPAYGLTRKFQVQNIALSAAKLADVQAEAAKSAVDQIFPATFCSTTSGADNFQFSGQQAWSNLSLDASVGDLGACFQVTALDKTGAPMATGQLGAFGRRNPVLTNPLGPQIQTPLALATQIPVVVRICDDDPAAASMIDTDFFNYQEFILGISNRPVDLCFHIGAETKFATDFTNLLAARLGQAKAAATSSADFLFVVLLHEAFSSEFTTIQSSMASALYALINSEITQVSPRLAGAFIYDSTTNFAPNATQSQLLAWCPQNLASQILTATAPLFDQNCTTSSPVQLDLKVINFVTPLGPFPSQSVYDSYVKDYGDKGLARGPKLNFYSVPAGANTLEESGKQVTYFDNERYVIGTGEAARICQDRENDQLDNFRIRNASQASDIAGTDIADINALWLSGDAAGEYKIGIAWSVPFWGGISYQGALNGKVGSIVPYTKSFAQYQDLGDTVWSQTTWNFGQYTQHCYAYCDNPFFNAAGAYSAKVSWRGFGNDADCPTPAYPQYSPRPSGGGA